MMFVRNITITCLTIVFALTGCGPGNVVTISTPATQFVASISLQTIGYQLTYLTSFESQEEKYQGIFGMDVGCLDKELPCFDSPKLLLQIPEESDGNPLSPHGDVSSYSWSPDGKRIAFSATGIDENGDIFVSDWDGSNLKNITNSSEYEDSPEWSIDNQLMYTVCSEGSCNIVISDQNGESPSELLPNLVIDFATWTPDGEHILFVGRDEESVYQIYLTDKNGSNIKQVTHADENDIVPSVSTDGKAIFFTRSQTYLNNNFNYNVFSIDIDGKTEQAVTVDNELISANPSIAPIGDWLAFERGRGAFDIYLTSLDGGQLFRVTTEDGDKRSPKWRVVVNP